MRTIANEISLAQRLGDFTIFNEVRLCHAKHKVAACSVHTSTAEFGNVHAVLCCFHNVVGFRCAVDDKCVGHSHHREVHVTLASAVAALSMIFFSCAEVVPHVIGEHAIFDECVFLAVMTFVVNTNCAPFSAHGAVVNESNERRCHHLAYFAAVHACTFTYKVGFQTMTTGFVKEHSTAASFNNNRQRTRRSRTRFQLGDCLTRCAGCKFFYVIKIKEFKPNGATHGVVTGLHSSIARGNNTYTKKSAHLVVGGKDTFTVCHQNATHTVAIPCRHLHHCFVDAARCFICPFQQLHLACLRNFIRQDLHVVHLVCIDATQSNGNHTTRALFGRNRCRLGSLQ